MTPGHSTALASGDTADHATSTTWTPLAQIEAISAPDLDAADIKVSHMASPNQAEEYDPGWAESGEVTLELQFVKAQQTSLYSLFRVKKGWQITYQDGSTLKFNGYIKRVGAPQPDREGIVKTSATIKVSGLPLFTAAA